MKKLSVVVFSLLVLGLVGCGKPAPSVPTSSSHAAAEQRLMLEEGFTPGQLDIFGGADDARALAAAYQRRSDRIAYRETDNDDEDSHDRFHAQER